MRFPSLLAIWLLHGSLQPDDLSFHHVGHTKHVKHDIFLQQGRRLYPSLLADCNFLRIWDKHF